MMISTARRLEPGEKHIERNRGLLEELYQDKGIIMSILARLEGSRRKMERQLTIVRMPNKKREISTQIKKLNEDIRDYRERLRMNNMDTALLQGKW